jgi:uroporphyrinogen decarboxylase
MISKMTSRERVLTALSHQTPDRVPIACGCSGSGITDEVAQSIRERIGIQGVPTPWRSGHGDNIYDARVMEILGSDFRHLMLVEPVYVEGGTPYDEHGNFTNEWGIYIEKTELYYNWVGNPLEHATFGDIESYPWPNPYNNSNYTFGLLEKALTYMHDHKFAISTRAPTRGIFELAIQMRGFEKYLMDMAIDPDFALRLADKIGDTVIAFYDVLLSVVGPYVDIVETQDDLAHQQALFMSPSFFRKIIKPAKQRLNQLIQDKAPQAKIYHHSCGAVEPLIDDLIEIGVGILNPIQPLATGMKPALIKQKYGDKLSFLGAIDLQHALSGPPEWVNREVRQRIFDMAEGGGFILAPSNVIQSDVSTENVLLLYQKAKEYGAYPIQFDTSDLEKAF